MTQIGTRLLSVTVDGNVSVGETSTAKITSGDADSDFITFADAAAGGARQYNFEFTAAQDMAADTLWTLMWTAPGSEVDVLIAPYGNVTASPTQPHLAATVVVKEPDGDLLGGDADVSTSARMTWSGVWPCTAKPTLITS
jgi:hypothetical protein